MQLYRDRLDIHLLDLYVPPAFNRQDNPVNLLFRPLDLHGDGAIIFIPDPAGCPQMFSCEAGTVPDPDAGYKNAGLLIGYTEL